MALPCALLLLLSGLAGCGSSQSRRTTRVPIAVARVEQRNVPYEIEATGTVEPVQSAQVTAQVSGLVTRVLFREGDEVRAGQVLVQLDRRPLEAAVERAAAVLARDQAQEATARAEMQRAQTLAERQVIAATELDQKRSNAEALAATVRADQAALRTARLDLANATIRAPISGTTGNLSVHLGDLVRANETAVPLVTINQIRPIRVRFTVPQADLADIRQQRGRDLRVDVAASSGPDSAWASGRLVFMDNQVDPGTGTLMLKGELENREGRLWPGAFVRVRLRLYEQEGATVVPAVAVSNSQAGPYLYVVKADTTVEARPVQVRRTYRDLAVIAAGVNPGETIVTDGQLRLSDGAKAVIRDPAERRGGERGGAGSAGAAPAGATRATR